MKFLDFLHLYFDAEGDGGNGGDNGANDNGTHGSANNNGTNGNNVNQQNNNQQQNNDDRSTPRYSDEDLDKIIEKKLAKWRKQTKAEVDEATRLANMTAQERAEHERDKLQKELDDLKRANTLAEMEKTARNILSADGWNLPDNLISPFVDEDADKTSENIKAFSKALKKFVQDEVKRELTHKTPASGGAGTITKAEIMKEKDPLKRQKLIRENLALFNK